MALTMKLEATGGDEALARAMKSLKAFGTQDVQVGFLQGVNQWRKGDRKTNAFLGYIHEHGSPVAGIPARPFLRPVFEEKKADAAKRIEAGLKKAADGNIFAVPDALEMVGMEMRDAAKDRITDGLTPDLLPGTINARKRAGFKGTKPLVRTGQLLNSIHYKVRK